MLVNQVEKIAFNPLLSRELGKLKKILKIFKNIMNIMERGGVQG